jgi:outer membrane receptor for ferrienterochelin and colicins
VPGLFGEYTLTGLAGFTLIAGLRADFHNQFGTFVTPRFHLRYELNPSTIFRASAGKGYRTTNLFSENTALMASSRQFVVNERLKPEEAWNYGVNASTDIDLFGLIWTINAEYYRTDFLNQVIVDIDRDPNFVYFYNLKGKSYSNSFQIDLTFKPIKRLDVTMAYRFNDVKMTINNEFQDKPLTIKQKGFINLSYTTFDEWQFDFTADYNGGTRLPYTNKNPVEYRLSNESPDFVMINAQITKTFDWFSIYLGGENLTNFTQTNPILAYNNPFGPYFDSSIIWGPLIGRKFYLGVRLNPF